MESSTKNPEKSTSQEKQLDEKFKAAVADKNREKLNADKTYDEILKLLPVGNTNRDKMLAMPNEYKEGIRNFLVYMKETRDFIKKNGDTGLSPALVALNDMEGLNGFWNWSDKNVALAKEIAIFLAATVLTFGTSAILSGAAIAARSAQVIALKRTADAGKAGQKIYGAIAAGAGGTARSMELGSAGVRMLDTKLNASRLNFVWNAGKFTVAESTIREMFRTEGELSGFEDFGKKFLTNTVMFGAIHGMEKFVTRPIAKKFF